jgi:hypothetical protein
LAATGDEKKPWLIDDYRGFGAYDIHELGS